MVEDESSDEDAREPPRSAADHSVLSLILRNPPTASALSTPIAANPSRLITPSHSTSGLDVWKMENTDSKERRAILAPTMTL